MKTIKTLFFVFILLISITSCKEKKNDEKTDVLTLSSKEQSLEKTANEGTYLCKINGKDWHYTKASGILTTNRKTGKKTALITFKRKLEKGSESIQLGYDGETLKLRKASVQLKFPKKDGGNVHGFYRLDSITQERQPESSLSGIIDLSSSARASGTAQLNKLPIGKRDRAELKNPEDAIINVTDLKFSNVGYSDTSKLFKK